MLLSLTACSGDSDQLSDSTDAAPAEAGGAEAPADGAAGAGGAEGGAGALNPGGAARNAVDLQVQQALIRTGAVSLRSDDVGQTRFDVQVLVDQNGGQVVDDKTETDRSGEALRTRMVLRVPVDGFDEVMDALGRMETLASTTTSSEDVTTQLIDVEARIEVQQASVQRVRQLLARAASIRDIMAIESELANRQAQLDSLLQQQAYLKDQTSMSTIRVSVERKPDPDTPTSKDDSGFLAGLAAGWDGLKATLVAVATVVGAVLPFAGVALLVGIPVWLLARRMRRTPAVPAPAATPGGE